MLDEWLQIYGLYKYQDKDYEQSTDFDKDEIVFYLRYGGRNIDYVLYFSTFLALLHLTYLVVFDNVYSVWYIFRIGLVIIGLTVITDLVDYMKNKELYTDLSKLENDIYNDDFLSEYFDEGKAVDLLYMACLRDHVWEFLVNHGKEIREVELNVNKENEFGLGMDDSAVNIKYHPFSEKLDIHISELRSNSPVLIKSNTGRYARLD